MFIRPKEVIDFLSSNLFILPGMKIADFGCGGGYFATFLAEKTGPEGKVFAIDIQADAIKEAKELAEALRFENIEFHQSDVKKTAFTENFFDVVFISSVLFQNKNLLDIIKEAKRILKDKGFLVVLEPKDNSLPFIHGNVVEKDKILSIIKEEKLNLVVDKTIGENYYLLVLEK
jgi:ubiquinone/menaquinone biosynthesis C-methylase UbiE